MTERKYILPTIIFSQFACTSVWFAGNAVLSELTADFVLSESALSHITSVIQFGFISGTLVYSFFNLPDKFSPSRVFFFSALIVAFMNSLPIFTPPSYAVLLLSRFTTGFALAGVYPVGMKIAADYRSEGLGKALGYLVGALVLGTAFPFLLKGLGVHFPWQLILGSTSLLALIGGVIMLLFIPDGPYRKSSQKMDLKAIPEIFKNKSLRRSAFGYFGHMWELYTFFAFVPVLLRNYFQDIHPQHVSVITFCIIASGCAACIAGGYISVKRGSKAIAMGALSASMLCCLLLPLLYLTPYFIFIPFLIFWGAVVAADSPQFSTLVSKSADANIKGTALTIVTCVGFFISIVSIYLTRAIVQLIPLPYALALLAIGPFLGVLATRKAGVE